LEAFQAGLNRDAEIRLKTGELTPELGVDAVVSVSDLTARLFQELKRLEPFGFSNSRPLLMLPKVRLAAPPRVVGERHLKLKIADAQNRSLDVIGFGWGECARNLIPGNPLDLAGHLSENTWNGATTLQMELKDLHWNE
jgi:single-stranded-DNA-specific exonuclease